MVSMCQSQTLAHAELVTVDTTSKLSSIHLTMIPVPRAHLHIKVLKLPLPLPTSDDTASQQKSFQA